MSSKIIYTTGDEREIMPQNDKCFSLKEMQDIVGGYIEIVFLRDKECMVVNEEGKIKNLPINGAATEIIKNNGIVDIIMGDVLVCPTEMIE